MCTAVNKSAIALAAKTVVTYALLSIGEEFENEMYQIGGDIEMVKFLDHQVFLDSVKTGAEVCKQDCVGSASPKESKCCRRCSKQATASVPLLAL